MQIAPQALEKSTISTPEFVHACNETLYKALQLPLLTLGEATFASSSMKAALFNAVIYAALQKGEERGIVEKIEKYFAAKNLPYSWWLESNEETPALLALLKEKRFASLGDFLGMALTISDIKAPQVIPELQIEEVTSEQDFIAWGKVITDAFLMESTIAGQYTKLFMKAGKSSDFVHLAGKIDGKIVTTGSLLVTPHGAYLYNCATAEPFRKKGYASVLMHALLKRAEALRSLRVGLLASPFAAGLFQKLGFKQVSLFHIYVQ